MREKYKEENKIKVLIVEPLKRPYPDEIDGSLKSMRASRAGLFRSFIPSMTP